MQDIHRDMLAGNICRVTLDQAGSAVNVLNARTLAELDEHLRGLEADPALRGVVFISAKDRVFCAGADLHALPESHDDELRRLLDQGQDIFRRIAALPVPTVAAIHGACVGGGYELALACRYRIATPDRATTIGLPETKLGLIPAWGGSTRLPRLVGVPRALDLILAGKTPAAKPALKLGLIDEIAPREYLLAAAVRAIERGLPPRRRRPWNGLIGRLVAPWVRSRVKRQTRGHYPALPKAIEVVVAAVSGSEQQSLARERSAELELARTDASRSLVRLFLLQEHARKPVAGEMKPVARAAVIGAGVMGAGIAQWLASRGVRVVLRDVDAARVAAGLARIGALFGNRRVFTDKEARDGLDCISPVTSDVPLGPVDLVIEAAVEKLDVKRRIFAGLDVLATSPDTVLATNTSALSIAEIAGATKDPGRVVGLHFFNPVHKMPLVEVVAGRQTRPEVVQRAARFAQQIGKLPVVVNDSPGFVVNRVLLPYLVEAGRLFEAGAGVADIDEAMLDFGMPMGPLRLIDEVGVDVAADVAATLAAGFSDRMRVPAILGQLTAAGWLGCKTGRGFYVHSPGKKAFVNDAIRAFRTGQSAAGLGRAELQRRLVRPMLEEAARCVAAGIVAGPDDVDLAMVMGTGFAPFRGGPLQFAASAEGRRFHED